MYNGTAESQNVEKQDTQQIEKFTKRTKVGGIATTGVGVGLVGLSLVFAAKANPFSDSEKNDEMINTALGLVTSGIFASVGGIATWAKAPSVAELLSKWFPLTKNATEESSLLENQAESTQDKNYTRK